MRKVFDMLASDNRGQDVTAPCIPDIKSVKQPCSCTADRLLLSSSTCLCPTCSKGGRKTKQERREAPMFQTVVEMHSHKEWHVYTDVARHVDALLAGKSAPVQLRRHLHGKMLLSIHEVSCEAPRLKRNRGNDTWIDDLLHATQAMLASQ